MDRGAWQAAEHGVAKSRTRLSDYARTLLIHLLHFNCTSIAYSTCLSFKY